MTMTTRKVKILQINISANLGLTAAQAGDPSCIRRYAHSKGFSLPGDIEVVVEATPDSEKHAFIVHVYEDPDSE